MIMMKGLVIIMIINVIVRVIKGDRTQTTTKIILRTIIKNKITTSIILKIITLTPIIILTAIIILNTVILMTTTVVMAEKQQ